MCLTGQQRIVARVAQAAQTGTQGMIDEMHAWKRAEERWLACWSQGRKSEMLGEERSQGEAGFSLKGRAKSWPPL